MGFCNRIVTILVVGNEFSFIRWCVWRVPYILYQRTECMTLYSDNGVTLSVVRNVPGVLCCLPCSCCQRHSSYSRYFLHDHFINTSAPINCLQTTFLHHCCFLRSSSFLPLFLTGNKQLFGCSRNFSVFSIPSWRFVPYYY